VCDYSERLSPSPPPRAHAPLFTWIKVGQLFVDDGRFGRERLVLLTKVESRVCSIPTRYSSVGSLSGFGGGYGRARISSMVGFLSPNHTGGSKPDPPAPPLRPLACV